MQAISLQLLNVFTSNWAQRFLLVGLEIFAYTENTDTLLSHFITPLQRLEVFVMLLTVASLLNKSKISSVYRTMGTVHAGFIGTLHAPTSPEMQLFMTGYTELKQLETGPCVGL